MKISLIFTAVVLFSYFSIEINGFGLSRLLPIRCFFINALPGNQVIPPVIVPRGDGQNGQNGQNVPNGQNGNRANGNPQNGGDQPPAQDPTGPDQNQDPDQDDSNMVLPEKTDENLNETIEKNHDDYWICDKDCKRRLEDEYLLGDVIGRGASSVVYKCLRKGRTEWACKVFKKSHLNKKLVQTEIRILLTLKHPNIVQLKEVFETNDEIQLILELVNGGELFERIVEKGQYSEQDAAQAVRHILSALQYLHSNGIVHRDIKPENLLYESESDDSILKLADFGLSKLLTDKQITMNTVCGTVGYCAPEILLHKEYDSSIDLWSLGVVTYIMLCGFEPFWDDGGEVAVCRKVVQGDYSFPSPWWDEVSDSAKDLIVKLLSLDPKQRPTAEEALNHHWTTGVSTPSLHMNKTIVRLKEFNARRKFRVATKAIMASNRALHLLSSDRKRDSEETCDCFHNKRADVDASEIDKHENKQFVSRIKDGRSDQESDRKDDKAEDSLAKELSVQYKENYVGLG